MASRRDATCGLNRGRLQRVSDASQCCGEGFCGLKPLGRILFQRDHDDVIERFGQVRHHLDRGLGHLLQLRDHYVEIAFSLKGP
jgi:hypothetical protein